MQNKICVPITAKTIDEALIDLKSAEKLADMVELRIDFIKNIDEAKLKELLKNKTKKVIVTCRPKKEGGFFTGSEKERLNLLKYADKLNCDYIDVEFDLMQKNFRLIEDFFDSKIILSYHNFKETPSLNLLEKIYDKIKELNPDLVKIVTYANSINDNFTIFRLLKNNNPKKPNAKKFSKRRFFCTPLISFCMGLRGQISRILAPKYGSCITFASLHNNKESASGQIAIQEMINIYNFPLINPKTRIVGVIGEFAENSGSKFMHNPNFKNKKLDFVYIPFKVRREELEEFMKNFRESEFAGASVTIPHKVEVIKYLDSIDDTSQKIGAVNTIVNKNGKLIGYNTDYYGAIEALKEITPLDNKKVLLIGAGGAARAIIYGVKREKADITILNRTLEKAQKLAEEFNIGYNNMRNLKKLISESDIIINATSVGMHPDTNQTVVGENEFVSGKIFMDIVYKPILTKFIMMARKANCKVITGDRMLIYQAIRQFKHWTGKEADFKLIK